MTKNLITSEAFSNIEFKRTNQFLLSFFFVGKTFIHHARPKL